MPFCHKSAAGRLRLRVQPPWHFAGLWRRDTDAQAPPHGGGRARGVRRTSMNAPLKIGLASALALATAAPAFAQPYDAYRPTDQYQRDLDRYQSDRNDYDNSRAAYADSRADYQAARRDYERRRADWEAARADYDARYGYGSYLRIYGPAPVWDEARWSYV